MDKPIKKPVKIKPGWFRHMNNDDKPPVTLPVAPWDEKDDS